MNEHHPCHAEIASIKTRRSRLTLLAALSLAWLLPFTCVGTKLGRLPFHVPNRLWQQYATAGLFTLRCSTWSDWHIEIRRAGSGEWHALDMAEVSPMPATGYRQRMDRILGDTRSKKIGESLRRRLAVWMVQKLEHQTGQQVTGVRYLHRSWQTNTPELAFPAGHWDGDEALPATTRVSKLGEYEVVNGRATPMQSKSTVPVPVPVPQPRIFRRAPAAAPPANA